MSIPEKLLFLNEADVLALLTPFITSAPGRSPWGRWR